jgi:hypothetical protein
MGHKGLTISENELGVTAVRLHYSADPGRDVSTPEGAAWHERARRLYPDPQQWAQEMEINFWVTQGARVYPEFSEQVHCMPLQHRTRKVIYRAWDFGWHAPACLIAQIDPQDRLVILREIIGREQTTRDFAKHVIQVCTDTYGLHTPGYEDFCDPAGQQVNAAASERNEVRDVEILNKLGIYPKWEWGWSRKDGRSLVHQLLQQRLDGTPGLYVDPAGAPVLVQGFLGKYVYPERKEGQVKDEPDESNHPWSDAHAALRYLATGLYSALGLKRLREMPKYVTSADLSFTGYGTPKRRA